MTIKKVRILDVHPNDPRFEERDEYIGNIYVLDVEDVEYIDGWQASILDWNKTNFITLDYAEVYAMKMEEIYD